MKMTFSKTFAAVFALALVLGSDAALPNIGSCKFMEYFCSARKCETDFYRKVQKDPKGDCSAKYNEMFKCVTKTLNICMEEKLTTSQIKTTVEQNFGENLLCTKGSIEMPDLSALGAAMACSSSFRSNSSACMKTFHEKFSADASDTALCREQANAKQCLKKLFKSDCNFPAQIQELFDLSFSDHNPFCANNRDPGATGKEQCDGVKDITTSAAAGHKSSALKALLVSVLSLLFFTKI